MTMKRFRKVSGGKFAAFGKRGVVMVWSKGACQLTLVAKLEMGRKKKLSRAEVLSAAKKKRGKRQERRKPTQSEGGKHAESATLSSSRTYSVDDYMTKVEEYLDTCQVDMAVKFCERALQLEPNNLSVLDTMGPLLLETGEADRAFQLFQHATSLSPEEGHTKYLYLGQLAHGEEAVRYLTKGIEILARSEGAGEVGVACELSSAYCALAEVYLTDICFEADAGQCCYECCCKATELSPSNPEAYQLMASCLLSQQLLDRAKEAMMKGLGLWLPSLCGKGEESQEGAASMEQQRHFPSYSSRVGVAKLLLELEEHDLAFEVLEGLLREDDEVVGVWYLMGWLHYLTNDADSAKFYLEQTTVLYSRLSCDEEELLTHATEILAEISTSSCGTEEGEGEEEGLEDKTCATDNDMDVS